MSTKFLRTAAIAGFLTLMIGCSSSTPPAAPTTAAADKAAPKADAYLAKTKPAGALNVADARSKAEDGKEIVLVGRIGGEEKPFVEGVAAFTIVDLSLKPCEDGEGCPTPWDYCCSLDKLPTHKALIKVVDAQGAPVETDARAWLGVKESSSVVVKGTAKKDAKGNLSVLAQSVFVEAK